MEAIQITIPIESDVQVLCDLFGITPEDLLKQYMRDLCSMALNGGSDERMMAKDYFLRTHLAAQNDFTMQFAPQICEEFESLYQSAYPAISDPNWQEQRAEMLLELYQEWKNNIKNFQSATIKK